MCIDLCKYNEYDYMYNLLKIKKKKYYIMVYSLEYN